MMGFVHDASASEPGTWEELEAELDSVFAGTQQAVRDGQPIVYVVHEPSMWGHTSPLRSALATALLGAMRSAAVELARSGGAANVLAVDEDTDGGRVARTLDWLLAGDISGAVVTAGTAHLGRPAA